MNDFYPELTEGNQVIFAVDPNLPASAWRLGLVCWAKNFSADIVLFGGQRGIEVRHDCLHADDPQCKSTRIWAEPGRGVFRLSPAEYALRQDRIDRQKERDEREGLRNKIALLEQTIEGLATHTPAAVVETPAQPSARPRGRPPLNRSASPSVVTV